MLRAISASDAAATSNITDTIITVHTVTFDAPWKLNTTANAPQVIRPDKAPALSAAKITLITIGQPTSKGSRSRPARILTEPAQAKAIVPDTVAINMANEAKAKHPAMRPRKAMMVLPMAVKTAEKKPPSEVSTHVCCMVALSLIHI